jgi:hypothetical protein
MDRSEVSEMGFAFAAGLPPEIPISYLDVIEKAFLAWFL